jgi:hypothetical protein
MRRTAEMVDRTAERQHSLQFADDENKMQPQVSTTMSLSDNIKRYQQYSQRRDNSTSDEKHLETQFTNNEKDIESGLPAVDIRQAQLQERRGFFDTAIRTVAMALAVVFSSSFFIILWFCILLPTRFLRHLGLYHDTQPASPDRSGQPDPELNNEHDLQSDGDISPFLLPAPLEDLEPLPHFALEPQSYRYSRFAPYDLRYTRCSTRSSIEQTCPIHYPEAVQPVHRDGRTAAALCTCIKRSRRPSSLGPERTKVCFRNHYVALLRARC